MAIKEAPFELISNEFGKFLLKYCSALNISVKLNPDPTPLRAQGLGQFPLTQIGVGIAAHAHPRAAPLNMLRPPATVHGCIERPIA